MKNSFPIERMTETRTAILGAYIVALGSISTAIYTPALPEMVLDLGTTDAAMKFSVSIFFAGFAISQLFCGPLSDIYGRRPVTISFLLLYILASFAAMVSTSIEMLLVSRLIQGVGAAIGVSVSRAIVRDLYSAKQSSRVLNFMAILGALSVALAPIFGGLIVQFSHWRMAFAVVILIASALAMFVFWGIAETRIPIVGKQKPNRLLATTLGILSSRDFLIPGVAICGTVGTTYAMSSILPFYLVSKFSLEPTMLGAALAIHPAAYFFGSLLARLLMKWHHPDTLVPLGLTLLISGASGLLSLNFINNPSLLYVGSAISLVGLGLAQVSPPLVTAVMSNQAKNAGLASSLLGFSQMMTGFLIGAIASMIPDPTLAYATIAPGAILLASGFGVYWYATRNMPAITSSPQTLR